MTDRRTLAIALAALACGAMVIVLVIASDHQVDKAVWAIFGPLVAWNFVGTGLYAWRRHPESRAGMLMVLFGFAWCVAGLGFANSPLLYTLGFVVGSLGGGLLLHLVMGFPSGRLES